MNRQLVCAAVAGVVAVGLYSAGARWGGSAAAEPPKAVDPDARVLQLQDEVKRLQGIAPDQAAVMTHVGYHFTNLWFAIEQENWPLAEFYQGEALNNIKWAVRTKPFRKAPDGSTVDLGAIAQAIENTQFADLKKAIAARQKDSCGVAYRQTLQGCYACHVASGKPYLKPHVPDAPEVHIINFDPNAKVQ